MSTQRTKIIATIGPASNDVETLTAMMQSGMNMARLNFSHGTAEGHAKSVTNIRRAAEIAGLEIAILQDLPGPKIRLGRVAGGEMTVPIGADIDFIYDDFESDIQNGTQRISVPSFDLSMAVRDGDLILLADGAVKLGVINVDQEEHRVTCEVLTPGKIRPNQGVNLPRGFHKDEFLAEKDIAMLRQGEELGVDYVALSFVQRIEDIAKARLYTSKPLIVKIEKPLAIENLEALIVASDGVMIARGDLGVEMSLAQIPVLQKRIIKMAGSYSKLVITATQMLESMIVSASPTRAEVTDVANAIIDGSAAIMLSAETAIGANPVVVIKTMQEIALEAEQIIPHEDWLYHRVDAGGDAYKSLARAAVFTAEQADLKAFLVPTESGFSAQILSSFRPNLPIHAFTFLTGTERLCQMYWGVQAHPIKKQDSLDNWIKVCITEALRLGLVEAGDKVGILTTNHVNHLLNVKTV